MSFFSVIIPVFNKEKFIDRTLRSVLSQSFTDFEVIIINDGSTDNSESKIKTFNDPRIRYHYQTNQGVAVARNLGIREAKSSFICFLDADDFWYPYFLQTMKKHIDSLPQQSVFACAIEVETPRNSFSAKYSICDKKNYQIVNYFEGSQHEAAIWISSVAIKKEVFQEIGNFDEKLKVSEDTDLWIRIGLRYSIVFIHKIMSRYVYDDHSISRNMNYIFEDYFFEKYREAEIVDSKLKQYLDLNRFSSVIKLKITGNRERAHKIASQIAPSSLSVRKRIILKLPVWILKILIRVKKFMADNGLGNAVFR